MASLAAAPAVQDTSDGSEPDDAETYVVAAVLDRRDVGDGAQYLVHWEGFDVCDATWEPEEHLAGASEAVSEFWSRREACRSLSERRLAVVAPQRHARISVPRARASSGVRMSRAARDVD